MIALLRDIVFKDSWLKLFSFVMAVLIWFTVYSIQRDLTPLGSVGVNTQRITFYNVPVSVLSSASDVHDLQVEPKQVEVTVEGNAKILETLQSKDVRALVDLTGIEAASDLQVRIDVSTPPGVTHVRVRPQNVKVITPVQRDNP